MAEQRLAEIESACKKLLVSLCGPGDFLHARVRALIVLETYGCTAKSKVCKQLLEEGSEKDSDDLLTAVTQLEHSFTTPKQCSGLGPVVHAIANLQRLSTRAFYQDASNFIVAALKKHGEPVPENSQDMGAAYMSEVLNVVASTVAILNFYRAVNRSPPTPPDAPEFGGEPRFKQVTDFISSGFSYKDNAWGPFLNGDDIKRDVLQSKGIIIPTWMERFRDPFQPISKWMPAIGTGVAFFEFAAVIYPYVMDLSYKWTWDGQAISRLDTQAVVAAYTKAVDCTF
eukprot:TRINITY_DN13836_c0_g1_i2.p1 TRINITY_DN13836_c0_g1~~TRINITY_DN13836_c0_g1_i2.p1  ORF type:complete len:284 (+),score=55.76 TRINITY_DN13836_c0_g1_i2:71-922(+)